MTQETKNTIRGRLADIERASYSVLRDARLRGYYDRQIAALSPRELVGLTYQATSGQAVEIGHGLYDQAEKLVTMTTNPVATED